MLPFTLTPLGDSAVVITLGTSGDAGSFAAVSELAATLRAAALKGVEDIVPAYDTVTIFYEPARLLGENAPPYLKLCASITAVMPSLRSENDRQRVAAPPAARVRSREIPVCYGGEYGLDLFELAMHTGLTEAEVVTRHSQASYRVQAIGFAPGFPYLNGLPPELAMPRRATPRTQVPAGSVGIGGAQTGVYPRPSPGGWRLIGRTPLKLFDVHREEPAWLRVGDLVTFRSITEEEFVSWK